MQSNVWIRCQKPNPAARLRLFCFPYAGGGASIYRTWANDLPDQVEVCAIQLPGRENRIRETPFTQIEQLVETLIPVLQPFLDRPFALFGHSMGSMLVYELAQQLKQIKHLQPVHLFVSGRRPPYRPNVDPPLHGLPDMEFLQAIQQRYGGVPEVILQDAEMRALFVPLLRADFTKVETYHCSLELLDYPITAFGGLSDAYAQREQLLEWADSTRSSFELHMLPGGHFYLNDQQQALLQKIAELLPLI